MKPIVRVPKNALVVAEADESALLIDGRAYYRTVYHAIERARSFVVVSGWQFDSAVPLLRGEDAALATRPVKLLEFLSALCDERPELTIYILAWDFSFVYAQDRESNQREKFMAAHPRIRFEWDAHPELTGSHHQKFVVVDGLIGFAGGIDLCDARWDDCTHHADNPQRVNVSGQPCKPYHDLQAAFTGPIVHSVLELFLERWARATDERLVLTEVPGAQAPFDLQTLSGGNAEVVCTKRAALSRTQADSRAEPALVGEILQLYSDAIAAAERLIYIETQYFTSRSLARSFHERMADKAMPKLEIVLVMPRGADSALEKMVLEDAQDGVLRSVMEAASEHGHGMCAMYPVARDAQGGEHPTFIHSKLLIVDDQLLIVGSANMTERSVALDSELTITWEAEDENDELVDCIRHIRTRLLAEHSGLAASEFELQQGLVAQLAALVDQKSTRLRARPVGATGPLGSVLAEVFDAGHTGLTRGAPVHSG